MVSFSTPKYYEASEVDWSDEEEPQNESADADIDNKDERKQEQSDQDESPIKEAVNRTSQDIDPRVDAPPSADTSSNAPSEHSKSMSDIDRPSEESAESSGMNKAALSSSCRNAHIDKRRINPEEHSCWHDSEYRLLLQRRYR